MMHRTLWFLTALILSTCSACGERGAAVSGVIVVNGQPLQVAANEAVALAFVPKQRDEKSLKANPGADFKPADGSFQVVGLVPPGEYKISLKIRQRDGTDRLGEKYSLEETPLSYTVTAEPVQQLVIDIEKKTVARK